MKCFKFELKNFSYIKAFYNNTVSSAEIKATSEVTKNVPVSIIKPYINVHVLSFAQDIVQKKKSKLKKQSLRHCVRTQKGNQNEQQL